jgi:acetylglutamate kinase
MIVVKYGGHAMIHGDLAKNFATDVLSLVKSEEQVVVVHGGGPQIDLELKARGLSSQSVAGLRVTTPEMMNVVEMVLTGRVLRDVTNSLIQAGGSAVGITGRDSQTLIAKQITKSATGEPIDVGQVGEIVSVNTRLLLTLLDSGFIPVVAPISADQSGNPFNVNADSAAGAIAGALHAERALFLTDVPGLLRHWPDESTLIAKISYSEAKELLPTLADGMIPKIAACLHAIERGAKSAQIVDGREPGVLNQAIVRNVGTVITA